MLRYRERIAAQARIFKALGHPSRLLIADALRSGEKCVGDLQALVGGDISTVSRHLSVLREAGIVTSENGEPASTTAWPSAVWIPSWRARATC